MKNQGDSHLRRRKPRGRFWLVLFAGTIAMLSVTSLMAQTEDWPMFRGDPQRSGFVSRRLGFPSPAPLWKTGLPADINASPVISQNMVFIGCHDSSMYALDIANGSIVWKSRTNGFIDATAMAYGDTVVAPSHDGKIYLFKALSGETIGTLTAGRQLSSPAVSERGELLTGMGGPLNRFTMFPMFQQSLAWSGTAYFTQPCYSSPAVSGDLAAIGANDGYLRVINIKERRKVWELRTDGSVYLSTPAIRNNIIYFAPGDLDRAVYAVDLQTGNVHWRSWGSDAASAAGTAKGLAKGGRFAASPEMVEYLSRLSPLHRQRMMNYLEVYAPPSHAGFAKRSAQSADGPTGFNSAGGGIRTSSAAVDSATVYVIQAEYGTLGDGFTQAARYTLLCLAMSNGAERWRYSYVGSQLGIGFLSSPVVTPVAVHFGWADGKVYALDVRNGAVFWKDSLDGHIISSPAIYDDRIVFATASGTVYVYALDQTADGIDFQRSTYCYPNPAPGKNMALASNIQVFAPRSGTMSFTIYNTVDKPVQRHERTMAAGEKFKFAWDIRDVANGVYFVRIRIKYSDGGSDKKTVKLAVMK